MKITWFDLVNLELHPKPNWRHSRFVERAVHAERRLAACRPCPPGMADVALLPNVEAAYDENNRRVLRPDIAAWLDETCPGSYALDEHFDPRATSEPGMPEWEDTLFLRLPEGAALAFRLRWR